MKGDVHDEKLRSVVAPEGWSNPVPDGRYNLVVLGGGTAGLVCAVGAAGLGAKVALVEKDALGGDCLNTGCVPSKSLLASSHRAKALQEASLFGIAGPKTVKVDFSGVMERLRRVRAELAPHDGVERLTNAGVDVFFGEGRFVDVDRIAVDGVELLFRRAVIATGRRPLLPNLKGLDTVGYLTSETIFSLTERPRRLIVLGGGPIGVEMAQAFSRLGSDVTLVEAGPALLPRDDPDAVSVLTETLEADGVRILTNCTAVSVARKGKSCVLRLSRDGQEDDERGDAFLVATGRTPTLKGLGLQAAGVRVEGGGGLVLDDFLRTTNPAVFAAGDVASAFQFTHTADAMARIVIQNSLFGGRRKVSDLIVPWCTYTDPEVAQVGMTSAQACGDGVAFDLWEEPFA
ncbi:MAG: FAD-dependent oxidoreductase, partial [Planctomycetota bacterium]|nr:FAD-dependent oxidoreductase [Planctomycetota bacterium]